MTENKESKILEYETVDGVVCERELDGESRGYSEATFTAGMSPVSPTIKITKSKITVRWEIKGPGEIRVTVLEGEGRKYRLTSEGKHEVEPGTYQHHVNGVAYAYPNGGPPFTNWIVGKITSSVSW